MSEPAVQPIVCGLCSNGRQEVTGVLFCKVCDLDALPLALANQRAKED